MTISEQPVKLEKYFIKWEITREVGRAGVVVFANAVTDFDFGVDFRDVGAATL
jgi:hypothetical protein